MALIIGTFAIVGARLAHASQHDVGATIAAVAIEPGLAQAFYDMALRTPVSLNRARREFETAIAHEPESAQSRAGLAETYLLLREYGSYADSDAFIRARAAAAAAVALNPMLPAAHRDLAFIAFWFDRDLALARREFRRALELAPDDPQTHHWYATALSANGENRVALAEIARARQLDPQSVSIAADYALLRYYAGGRKIGLALLRQIIQDRPDQLSAYGYLSELQLGQGEVAAYLVSAGAAARLRHNNAEEAELEAESGAFRRGGRPAWLKARTAYLKAAAARGAPVFFQLARIAALHDDRSGAAAMLRKAQDRNELSLASLAADPILSSMLHDPRLAVFARRQTLAF